MKILSVIIQGLYKFIKFFINFTLLKNNVVEQLGLLLIVINLMRRFIAFVFKIQLFITHLILLYCIMNTAVTV